MRIIKFINQSTQEEIAEQQHNELVANGDIQDILCDCKIEEREIKEIVPAEKDENGEITTPEMEKIVGKEQIFHETNYFRYLTTEEKAQRVTAERQAEIQTQIADLKQQLTPLKEKIEQDTWGEVVPDIDDIKSEAIKIHTEMRRLEGKPPRALKNIL